MRNSININHNAIDVRVSVFLFKENGTYIAYCPSLDLSGYDLTEDKAKKDFIYNLQEWIKEQISNGTLDEDLQEHGWNTSDTSKLEPSVEHIFKKNKDAAKILQLDEFKKTNVGTKVMC